MAARTDSELAAGQSIVEAAATVTQAGSAG